MLLNLIKNSPPFPLSFFKRGGEEDFLLPFSCQEKGLGDEF
jgi:hypothetical protein